MSAAATVELRTIGQTFLHLYSHLSQEALDANLRRWKIVPEFQMFQHIYEESDLNSEENHQILLTAVARSCHVSTMAYVILNKWLCEAF